MPLVGERIETTSDNFGDMVRENCLLIDKTLMIQEFINGQNVSLITRSRRSGKSLNMSMLHYFFSPEVAGQATAGLFDQFAIAKVDDGQFLAQHQGKYPVISITFKDTKEPTFEGTINQLRNLVRALYREHKKLLSSVHIDTDDRVLFQQYLDGSADDEALQSALFFLSEFLYKAHGNKRVIILIDEYDTPLTHAYQYGFLDSISHFMRNMFSAALKGNPYLKKGVMTGILRVSKNELLSGLNNLVAYSLFDKEYSQYFGFTEEEVAELSHRIGVAHSLEEIRQYYNGYLIGERVIYNPWSLMNYLYKKVLSPYWVLTSGDRLLKKLFLGADTTIKDQMARLMQGEVISGTISMKTSYEALMENPDALWTLLLFAGYLTPVNQEQEDDNFKCTLRIPNQEILAQYRSIFKSWLKETLGTSQYDSFLKNLLSGNVAEFTQALSKYLMDSISFRDVGDKKENFYHGLVAGLVASVGDTHWVDSNKESGYGLYDIIFTPKEGQGTRGIVLEFKHVQKAQSIRNEAEKALTQIDESRYAEVFNRHRHITQVLKVGLAFSGKNVLSVYKEEDLRTHEHTAVTWAPEYSQEGCDGYIVTKPPKRKRAEENSEEEVANHSSFASAMRNVRVRADSSVSAKGMFSQQSTASSSNSSTATYVPEMKQ